MAKTKVVVITGAAAGVGRSVARAYAQRGASIGLLARSKETLQSAYREGNRQKVAPWLYRPM